MSLTYNEEQRIKNIENQLVDLQRLVSNAASKEMLNKLLALSNTKIKLLETKIDTLSTQATSLLSRLNKLV